jgi:hypothetical protein
MPRVVEKFVETLAAPTGGCGKYYLIRRTTDQHCFYKYM